MNLDSISKGDIINSQGVKEVVLARLEDLVWLQQILKSGARGPVSPATHIEDLQVLGYKHIEQYQCQSYFDDDNKLQNCTCGKCK